MGRKNDDNGSTLKGVVLAVLVALAAFGGYTLFAMFARAVG